MNKREQLINEVNGKVHAIGLGVAMELASGTTKERAIEIHEDVLKMKNELVKVVEEVGMATFVSDEVKGIVDHVVNVFNDLEEMTHVNKLMTSGDDKDKLEAVEIMMKTIMEAK